MNEDKKRDYEFLYNNLLNYYYEICCINPPGYENKMTVEEYIIHSLKDGDFFDWREINDIYKISILYPYVEKKIATMTTDQITKVIDCLNPEIHREMNRLCNKYNIYNINVFYFNLPTIAIFDACSYYELEALYYKHIHSSSN